MIGAGIFVLTGIAAGVAGPALILAFVLNGFAALFTAMAYAELGSCFHDAGGEYLWAKEGLPRWNGFISGWMSWFAHAVACSVYALGFGAYFEQVLRELRRLNLPSYPAMQNNSPTKSQRLLKEVPMKYFVSGMKSFVVLALISAPNTAFAQWRGPGGWDMGPGMMGWGILAWFGPIMMVIFWVAIIVAIIFFVRWLMASSKGRHSPAPQDSALEILKKRYARGEIGKEEFEEKKKDLT